jgi:hypothetical protein
MGRRRREHRSGDQVEVPGAIGCVLHRYDVGAEEGGLRGEFLCDPQCAYLVANRQPIAALDLHRRGSLPAHLGDPPGDQTAQLVIGTGAGRRHRDADPATVVRLARHPSSKLISPLAGKDKVSMRVDEAGQQRSAAEVDATVGGRRLG